MIIFSSVVIFHGIYFPVIVCKYNNNNNCLGIIEFIIIVMELIYHFKHPILLQLANYLVNMLNEEDSLILRGLNKFEHRGLSKD